MSAASLASIQESAGHKNPAYGLYSALAKWLLSSFENQKSQLTDDIFLDIYLSCFTDWDKSYPVAVNCNASCAQQTSVLCKTSRIVSSSGAYFTQDSFKGATKDHHHRCPLHMQININK